MKRLFRRGVLVAFAGVGLLACATVLSMSPVVSLYRDVDAAEVPLQAFDRNGTPLSFHYHARWNRGDVLKLYQFPPLLVQAMLQSEDKRFYTHRGIDWRARLVALFTNITHGERVRGASSITEQVVRMLHPRPRSLWAKWVEGFEAMRLESAVSKEALLEFYLNQVPYASGRRGVVQGARFYFGRDPDTLSAKEMLALVVLVRAPSSYDLHTHPERMEGAIDRLAVQWLDGDALAQVRREKLLLGLPDRPVDASHFLRYVRMQPRYGTLTSLTTTLDAALQQQVQHILSQRIAQLKGKKVKHASAIVLDHTTGEVLAWANAGEDSDIDGVTTRRQPGSAMKPFLYAQALSKGWSAATVIEDAPLREAIGTGLHRFRNYSQTYHGLVTVREALGNSLNIPALYAIRFVTPAAYLSTLHALGFASLDATADIYDEGLALGVGEVTPLELAAAYAALARGGEYRAPHYLLRQDMPEPARRVFSPEVAGIIGHILSDPWARTIEFGRSSILNLPVQTAVKTGTSTDYRDAWAAGYNYRYAVVVWMGNFDGSATDGITGSTGPALALRSIFAELTRDAQTKPLPLPRSLETHAVCADAASIPPCSLREEYFVAGTYPPMRVAAATNAQHRRGGVELVQPTDKLRLAYDPRIPADKQIFRFQMRGVPAGMRVRWVLNDQLLAEDEADYYDWPLTRGTYRLAVTLIGEDGREQPVKPVRFVVK